MADLVSPHGFFERLLSGPIRGRAKMVARLGLEVLDPIEELLVSALDQEQQGVAHFVGFLAAMDRAEDEIKREQEGPQHQVRIMTAHGSKGLQAPVVILADATSDPDDRREALIPYAVESGVDPVSAPLGSSKRPCHPRVAAAFDAARTARDEEHRRLLYVALTRAEEVLCLGGAMGKKVKPDGSNRWHDMVRDALQTALEVEPQSDPLWGQVWRHGAATTRGRPLATGQPPAARPTAPDLPDWIDRMAPEEARPPRPLAPSQLGVDLVADPPGDDPRVEAMLRGSLLHGLFERLPGLAPDRRAALADTWLIGQAGERPASWRQTLVAQALAIIDDPAHAALFGSDSLAEVPLSAVVGEKVIAGVVDRIRITDDAVELVDFKTGRRVPSGAGVISTHHLRQMAAYRDALRVIFPGRLVRAALLYTSGPVLFELADAQLDAASAETESGQ
jgi:ATP-dependent helicase/nuclease subunit A